MGLLFFPRGGAAYVVRYLSPALARAGWSVSLAAGSLGEPGEETHAPTFFDGLDVHVVDFSDAVRVFEAGGDAIAAPQPMHPSYEDRVGAPDVVLASVPPELVTHLSSVWEAPLQLAGADRADVFHLHHLTPQLEAARRRWPQVPLVAHLHGTELNLMDAITERITLATKLGETLATMPTEGAAAGAACGGLDAGELEMLRTTRWDAWRHGEFWAGRLRQQAQSADHLIAVSPLKRDAAISGLGIAPDRITVVPNGVDIDRFRPRPRTPGSRRATFRRVLVEDPQGWTESGPPGTLAYAESDLDRLLGTADDATVLIFVGRFLGLKQVPELIRSFARARSRFTRPGSLLIWGGHPGEWEGEHPVTVAKQVGADDIYFAGWRGHGDLPEGLAASDALVIPSLGDAYPQVPLEAMAVGLPVLGCASGGLPSMINVDPASPTGWLVSPNDPDALADALVRIVNNPNEVAERGANALTHARTELSWDGLVPRFEAVYAKALEHHEANSGPPTGFRRPPLGPPVPSP